jgi:hypothetical protein
MMRSRTKRTCCTRRRLFQSAEHSDFIPQLAVVAEDELHHVADQAFVLFELAGVADQLRVVCGAENLLGGIDQFRPGARRRDVILGQ